MNELSSETIKAIQEHAVETYPRESCGVVCVVKGRERYFPCRNDATNAQDEFTLNPQDLAAAEDQGEVIAYVHSHPNARARPSEADKVMCELTEKPWHIVNVSLPLGEEAPVVGEIFSFAPSGYVPDLIGRPFVHGVLDCYALVRDYFRKEHNIQLNDYPRTDDWWDRRENLYCKNFEAEGFSVVNNEPRVGDLFLMQIRSPEPNHAAVYIGNGQIIHHLWGRLSSRDVYGGYWREVTTHLIRHKDVHV